MCEQPKNVSENLSVCGAAMSKCFMSCVKWPCALKTIYSLLAKHAHSLNDVQQFTLNGCVTSNFKSMVNAFLMQKHVSITHICHSTKINELYLSH